MKSLRALLAQYEGFMSDDKIIEEYFVQNDLEDEAVQMISRLLQRKNEKLQKAIDYARTWAPSLPDASAFCKDKETAWLLNKIQMFAALGLSLDTATELKAKAQEIIPTIEVPKMFFLPVIGYLRQYGIYFKDNSKYTKLSQTDYPFATRKPDGFVQY